MAITRTSAPKVAGAVGGERQAARLKRSLTVVNVDAMASVLLSPYLTSLAHAGYEVHIACARSQHFPELAARGYVMHEISVKRSFALLPNLRGVAQLCRLIRKYGYDLITVHSPIGAAVGRLAAAVASSVPVVYVVHGFYFHDDMPRLRRRVLQVSEWLLGRVTTHMMFLSDEDRRTALDLGIVRTGAQATTIWNGVDVERYGGSAASRQSAELRIRLGILPHQRVIGIVGRIVREKGYMEFLEMAGKIMDRGVDAKFLVVGATFASDRDQFEPGFKRLIGSRGLQERFVFAGLVPDVERYLHCMDVFVLPSYREGFPRSVLEAMAAGRPVVTTNIRGCREAVVGGVSGLLVPPRDSEALAAAVLRILDDRPLALAMGRAGKSCVAERYQINDFQRRFISVVKEVMK